MTIPLEIDFSGLKVEQPKPRNDWRAPPHVYFGKRDENGMMEQEPVYQYQKYPAFYYKLIDGKIIPKLVNSDEEVAELRKDGWRETPAAFGYIGAPSFEDAQKIRAQIEEQEALAKAEELAILAKEAAVAANIKTKNK